MKVEDLRICPNFFDSGFVAVIAEGNNEVSDHDLNKFLVGIWIGEQAHQAAQSYFARLSCFSFPTSAKS